MEAKARFARHGGASAITCIFFSGYAVIFAHKGKSNTSFGTVKGLLLFVCTHNINKTLCLYKIKKTNMMRFLLSRLEQERFTMMNRNSVNTCLTVTDIINISIESFKLLLNEIKQIENKNYFIIIIIHKDALLSKGASNEEMASQDRQLHPENTSLLVNNSNISISPWVTHGNCFCWGFAASFSLMRAFECITLQLRWRHACCCGCCWTLNNRRAALDSHGSTVSCCFFTFHQRGNFFLYIYKNIKIRRSRKQARGPARVWTMTRKLARSLALGV